MKILVVSDTHGRNTNLKKAILNMGNYLDLMIHLGDSECYSDEIEKMVSCPVEMVKGNCDGLSKLPGAKLIDIGSHKALLTHGHMYGGKTGIGSMRDIARENGADIVMFGHIHEPIIDESEDVVVLNPGSLSQPRQEGHRPTYLVMSVEDDGRTDYSVVYL
ncbi:MAG: metallophosphoesterase [Lachnospiraceae bacterium]|nr:metallophosphoesterase [Lachnospiraceae bacterium]